MNREKLHASLLKHTAIAFDVLDQENEGIAPEKINMDRWQTRWWSNKTINKIELNIFRNKVKHFVCNTMILIKEAENE